MSAHIFFNQEYNVLICKTHQHAISPRYITRHFLEEYEVSLSVRQANSTDDRGNDGLSKTLKALMSFREMRPVGNQ